MPGTRESLLNAAETALTRMPWSRVRMVEVAARAGVSRQTLYNEFGSKEGLARALVRRQTDAYLAGVDRALAVPADPRERLAALADWTVTAASSNALVRAVLTGLWNRRLPAPTLSAVPSTSAVPAQRRADGPLPGPGELFVMVRERAMHALFGPAPFRAETAEQARLCELTLRLALSCLVVPPGPDGTAHLVRSAVHRTPWRTSRDGTV
jgi:AcrR family transcriptional regulator